MGNNLEATRETETTDIKVTYMGDLLKFYQDFSSKNWAKTIDKLRNGSRIRKSGLKLSQK